VASGLTSVYKLQLPDIGGDQDIWGGKLNENFTRIDTMLNNRIVRSATGEDTARSLYQICDTHIIAAEQSNSAAGTNDMSYASLTTSRWVETRIFAILNYFIPPGTIVMWAGLVTQIPAGWTLCNGGYSSVDLRDRIVLAAGANHQPGYYGGIVGPGLPTPNHTHAPTFSTPAGVLGAPEFLTDYGGGVNSSNDLPYYVVCYIEKVAYWYQGMAGPTAGTIL
jgi:hypothetical protein